MKMYLSALDIRGQFGEITTWFDCLHQRPSFQQAVATIFENDIAANLKVSSIITILFKLIWSELFSHTTGKTLLSGDR